MGRRGCRAGEGERESGGRKKCRAHGRNVQVEINPPTLPMKTVVPRAAALAVSLVTLAAEKAVQSEPKEKAPMATMNAAA